MTKPSAFITLLTSESYIPGTLVLGKTLKTELKTDYKLAILLDSTNITEKSLAHIKEVYDDIIPIDDKVISSSISKVIDKLGREELSITFSKILLWNQTKYEKLIYIDSDTLPLKSLDHLFTEFGHDLQHHEIVASPDIGWPDIFNSGLLILKPHNETYEKLVEFSSNQDASFDGADQGLLNEYFHLSTPLKKSNWKRLPFIYNVTPSSNYQYLPALTRFFKDINLLHFIGSNKPWLTNSNSKDSQISSSDFDFHQLWWDKFNKYFTDESTRIGLLNINHIKGEGATLNFSKLVNSWDSEAVVKNEEVPNLSELSSHLLETKIEEAPKLFPWEQRDDYRPPTRVFNYSETTYDDDDKKSISTNKISSTLNKDIETSPSTQTAKPQTSSSASLKKHYQFNDNQDNKFNPDKSLDEVSKLPIKLLSKKRESESKN